MQVLVANRTLDLMLLLANLTSQEMVVVGDWYVPGHFRDKLS